MSPAHRRAAQPALCLGSACARRVRQEAQLSTVQALLQALELKDPYTRGHSERVGELAALIAIELGATAPRVAAVRLGGTLHDIGKLGVPTGVLRKNGPLTADERRLMERHPADGDDVLRGISVLDEARAAVLHHHERVDGTGYPYGLGGGRIPEAARIVAVADAFDAMTSTRSYRSARPAPAALAELRSCAGTQFDPVMVEALGRALAASGWRPAEPVIRPAVPVEVEARPETPAAVPVEAGAAAPGVSGPFAPAKAFGGTTATGEPPPAAPPLPTGSPTVRPGGAPGPTVWPGGAPGSTVWPGGVPGPTMWPGGAPAPGGPRTVPSGPVDGALRGATARVEGPLLAAAVAPGHAPAVPPGTAPEAVPEAVPGVALGPAAGGAPPPAWSLTWAWLDSGAKGKEVG
ncbi:HD domain-containing phosphohydrolase [Actinacidiphila yeochonensis]|uniref:HD domain-containing phosphohydrolase n=1 Tax=Actinacidiphila yeochonensis TaxID=89050 RepID=UPI0006921F13